MVHWSDKSYFTANADDVNDDDIMRMKHLLDETALSRFAYVLLM